MATEIVGGQRTWAGSIDAEGHREWTVVFQTQGSTRDGPANHVQTPGLPVQGSVWAIDDDIDIWAWCRAGPTSITPRTNEGVNEFFSISFTYSTRPPGDGGTGSSPSGAKDDKGARKKCSDAKIEDPLSEPPAMSGGGIREQKEFQWSPVTGKTLKFISGERIRGPGATFDRHRDQIVIEQNVLNLEYGLVRSKMDKLNDTPLWDLPARCWKLSDWTWQRKLYGTCGFYFTRKLTFESNAVEIPLEQFLEWDAADLPMTDYVVSYGGKYWLSGWDHFVLEESSKVLHGHWDATTPGNQGIWVLDAINGAVPSSTNPNHYDVAVDRNYTPCRQVLSIAHPGQPARSEEDSNFIRIRGHNTTNFLDLNIPLS